jgi:hypothetical protein
LIVLFSVTIYGLIAIEDNTAFIALMAVAISLSATLLYNLVRSRKLKELMLREKLNTSFFPLVVVCDEYLLRFEK